MLGRYFKISIGVLTFILFAYICNAKTYKWIDENGVMHFTDDETSDYIPDNYRQNGKPNWIMFDTAFYYDKNSLKEIKKNIYIVNVIFKKEGALLMETKIDCNSKNLFTGTVTIIDNDGKALDSDRPKQWEVGQLKNEKGLIVNDLLMSKVCNK